MERTFHLRKGHRNRGWRCLAFFLGVGGISAYAIARAAVPEYREYAVVLASAFWGVSAFLAGYVLLSYWCASITIRSGQVIQQGVFVRKELDLDHVTLARWGRGRGSLSLRTMWEHLTIHYDHLELPDRLWLIRFCRRSLPQAVQRDWDIFCLQFAVPLRDDTGGRPLGVDRVRQKRSRWDRYFLPLIAVCVAAAGFAHWKFQEPLVWVAPLKATFVWLCLRFATPRQGLAANRLGADPVAARRKWILFAWGFVGVSGVTLLKLLSLPTSSAVALGTVGGILWFGGLIFLAYRCNRANRRRRQARCEEAVRTWDEGEASSDVALCPGDVGPSAAAVQLSAPCQPAVQ